MIPLTEIFKDGIDGTMIDIYQQCRRKFFNRIVRGLEMREVSVAADFGGQIHEALEGYNRGWSVEESIAHFEKVYNDRGIDDRRTTAGGTQILKIYFAQFPRESEPFEILSIEEAFKMDIGSRVPFAGRCDLIVRDKFDGSVWVKDYKTTTAYGDAYIDKFQMHTALDGYILHAKERFGSCEGAIIDVLVPQKTKPRVDRLKIVRSTEQLDYWREDVRRTIDEIEEFTIRNYGEVSAFTMSRARCTDYNSRCQYFDLCKYCDNKSIIEGEFQVNRWSPVKEVVK